METITKNKVYELLGILWQKMCKYKQEKLSKERMDDYWNICSPFEEAEVELATKDWADTHNDKFPTPREFQNILVEIRNSGDKKTYPRKFSDFDGQEAWGLTALSYKALKILRSMLPGMLVKDVASGSKIVGNKNAIPSAEALAQWEEAKKEHNYMPPMPIRRRSYQEVFDEACPNIPLLKQGLHKKDFRRTEAENDEIKRVSLMINQYGYYFDGINLKDWSIIVIEMDNETWQDCAGELLREGETQNG